MRPIYADEQARQWNAALTQLMNLDMTYADAALWSTHRRTRKTQLLCDRVRDYLDAGFTAREGLSWWRVRVRASIAVGWANAGWSPPQVEEFFRLFHPLGRLPGFPGPERATWIVLNTWRETGIPATRCLAYARAGTGADGAIKFEARRTAGEPVDDAIRTLTRLRACPRTMHPKRRPRRST